MPVPTPSDHTIQELDTAFGATRYRIETDAGIREVRIGQRHTFFDRLAEACRWCIITAHNPGARRVDSSVNQRAEKALERRLRARRPSLLLRAVNRDPGGRWPDEPGWLFTFERDAEVDELADAFGQLAVVIGDPGQPARLHFCTDPARVGRRFPSE